VVLGRPSSRCGSLSTSGIWAGGCQWVGSDQESKALTSIRAVTSRRVLLIIDYAETRTGLANLLRATAADRGAALRILMLARSAGPWWEQLGAGEPAVRDMITAAGPQGHALRHAVDTQVTDEELVRQAIPCFARELNMRPPQKVSIVRGTRRARILELHAAALVAVLDANHAQQASTSRVDLTDVLDELLRHEERFWLGTAQVLGLRTGMESLTLTTLRHIVAAGCLLGAADEDEAIGLLRRVPHAPSSLTVAAWLRALYPPEPEAGEWLGTLQPDRLAERHTVIELGSSEAFARRCLTGLNERQARRAIILLARAATEHDVAGQLLGRLLPLVSHVVSEIQAPPGALISIANAMPYASKAFADAGSAVLRRILENLPPGAPTLERCRWLSRYGVFLAQTDRASEALAPIEEAVAIYRELAAASSDGYRPDLANETAHLGAAYLCRRVGWTPPGGGSCVPRRRGCWRVTSSPWTRSFSGGCTCCSSWR
jgi:hypothetical protein